MCSGGDPRKILVPTLVLGQCTQHHLPPAAWLSGVLKCPYPTLYFYTPDVYRFLCLWTFSKVTVFTFILGKTEALRSL